jgi:hypothetical protein
MKKFTGQPAASPLQKVKPVGKLLTNREQNKLAKLYPLYFAEIPDYIPPSLKPYLFDKPVFSVPESLFLSSPGDYEIRDEIHLKENLTLKNYRLAKEQKYENLSHFIHRYTRQSKFVANSIWITEKVKEKRAERNFEQRKQAGAIAAKPRLGIVGSNLDKCNTSSKTKLEKKTRQSLYRAQNRIQKIRLNGKNIISDNVAACGKPIGAMVTINRNCEHNSSSVNSIHTCKSVWACPVCRQKIINRRADEMKKIYEAWTERGGQVNMLTLTVPHGKSDNLAELYGSNLSGTGISGALSKFRQSREFSKEFKKEAGYEGDVRGIEVTWGRANGFHPHIHIMMLTKYSWDFAKWKERFYLAWKRACLQAGLQEPSWEHGTDISHCHDAGGAEYMAKWSAASEVTSTSMKQAKSGNFSIAELEQCLWDGKMREQRKISMTRAASVLKSYYASMKGQKMLQMGGISADYNWKKELLGTDEDDSDTENHISIATIENSTYIRIKRTGKLSEFLEISERGDTGRAAREQMRIWLTQHGYDSEAIQNPHVNSPPPSCFSYGTKEDRNIFDLQKLMKRYQVGKFRAR